MLKGQDLVVLLSLMRMDRDWTMRSLAADLDADPSSIHRAIGRLDDARLIDKADRRVNYGEVEKFLIYAVRYAFPTLLGGPTRGQPTAWAAEPLSGRLVGERDLPPVWPDPLGDTRGYALKPVHPWAFAAARNIEGVHEDLALVDTLRLGYTRDGKVASDLLRDRVREAATGATR